MKNRPMRTKLIALCGFFLLIILLTNSFESFQMYKILQSLNDISKTQLPAIRKMSLVDMYHDGMVGVVYKSIYAAEINDKAVGKQAQDDFNESSEGIKKLLSEIATLNLKKETKAVIEESNSAINHYLETAKSIVFLSNDGKRQEAIAKIAEFDTAFHQLEIKLGQLGDLIQADAKASEVNGDTQAKHAKDFSLIFTGSCLLIGLFASIYVIRGLMIGIADSVENLSTCVHNVQNSSQVVSIVSKKLSHAVEIQASSITESVTAMDEISAMIKNNENSSSNALSLSELTKSSAETGKDTVRKMLNEMNGIAISYDEIQAYTSKNKEDINKIVDVINQIAKKTEVINDIVFQTKLLSFNASVEAARAGESGKGFAVVAEEVGNLAQMSGKASNDIEQMLIESQSQVKEIAELTAINIEKIVSSGRIKIDSGKAVVSECMIELEKIETCAYDLNSSISEISKAIKEQSLGVEEVNLALKQLDNTTNDSMDMADKSKSASDSLRVQSHQLRETIQGLRKVLGTKKSYDAPPLDSES